VALVHQPVVQQVVPQDATGEYQDLFAGLAFEFAISRCVRAVRMRVVERFGWGQAVGATLFRWRYPAARPPADRRGIGIVSYGGQ
jgi:hypothetical protein